MPINLLCPLVKQIALTKKAALEKQVFETYRQGLHSTNMPIANANLRRLPTRFLRAFLNLFSFYEDLHTLYYRSARDSMYILMFLLNGNSLI